MPVIRLALAQMNAVVGGFAQNVETLSRFRTQAGGLGRGTIVLVVDAAGAPIAYRWSEKARSQVYETPIALGRIGATSREN